MGRRGVVRCGARLSAAAARSARNAPIFGGGYYGLCSSDTKSTGTSCSEPNFDPVNEPHRARWPVGRLRRELAGTSGLLLGLVSIDESLLKVADFELC